MLCPDLVVAIVFDLVLTQHGSYTVCALAIRPPEFLKKKIVIRIKNTVLVELLMEFINIYVHSRSVKTCSFMTATT